MNIARSQFYSQRKSDSSFAGKNWSIRRLFVTELGNVANRGAFPVAVNLEGCGIGIDHCAVKEPKLPEELGSEFVVRTFQTLQILQVESPKESSQGIAMRKIRKTQNRGNESIVNERLSVLDSTDPSHDGKNMSQEQVYRMIFSVLVSWPADVKLQKVPEADKFAKLSKKKKTAVSGQTLSIVCKLHGTKAFGHLSQYYHFGRFVRSPSY